MKSKRHEAGPEPERHFRTLSSRTAGEFLCGFSAAVKIYADEDHSEQLRSFGSLITSDDLLSKASELVPVHGLRTLDAIQLASALVARELDPDCAGFACFDARLRRAAAVHGFQLIPSS